MNWVLILSLSSFGVLLGILSVLGFTKKAEPILWLIAGFFTVFMLYQKETGLIFWHGFIIGVSWGFLNSIIQSIFFETYLKNNPKYTAAFSKSSHLKPRYLILLVGPMLGLLTGAVLGGLSWFVQKFL